MKTSDQINEIASALAKFQLEVKPALKDSKNPFFKSNYADLASVFEAIRKPMFDNNLSVSQLPEMSEKWGPVLTTRIMHKSGQWLEGSVGVFMTKEDPQAHASAVTYTKRIALVAALGLSTTDDDAEAAMGRPEQKPQPKAIVPNLAPSAPVVNKATTLGIAESCSKCQGAMIYTKAKNAWYCQTAKETDFKEKGHDYLQQSQMDDRKRALAGEQTVDQSWPQEEFPR